jgi:hypothetical protein
MRLKLLLTKHSRFCASNKEPLLVGGDFNVIRYLKEKIICLVFIDTPSCLTL